MTYDSMEKEGRVVLAPLKKYLHIYNKKQNHLECPAYLQSMSRWI